MPAAHPGYFKDYYLRNKRKWRKYYLANKKKIDSYQRIYREKRKQKRYTRAIEESRVLTTHPLLTGFPE